jgi:cytochrome c peroxidase
MEHSGRDLPFMHAGQITTLTDVITHYDRTPKAPFGKSELRRLRLSAVEQRQLEAFLRTLAAPPTVGRDSATAASQ